jgi:CRP-like cAMP-binding protein
LTEAATVSSENSSSTALELLKTVRLLQGIPEGLRAKLSPMATVESVAANRVLFTEGALCDRIYFVVDGLVALDMYVPRRDPTRILTVGPGEVLAWSALLSDQRMTATATVLEDSRLVALAAGPLRQLCDSDHAIGFILMRALALALSRRLLATRLQLLDLFADSQAV